MKKLHKIISYSLLGTLAILLLGLVIVRRGTFLSDISEISHTVVRNISNFRKNDPATVNLMIAAILILTLVLGLFAVVQIRRRKSPLLPILAAVGMFVVIMGVVLKSYFADLSYKADMSETTRQQNLLSILYISFVIIALEYFALITVNVPLAFETAEFKPNSKKSDKMKLVDIIIASSIVVLYFVLLAVVFGNPFKGFGKVFVGFFKYFFNFSGSWKFPRNLIVPLGYMAIIGLGVLIYFLIKTRKTVITPLYMIFTALLVYTIGHYLTDFKRVFSDMFDKGNFFSSLSALVLVSYVAFAFIFSIYQVNDCILLLCEPKRLKLYNHREKYVYSERRKFGQSIIKEWETMKKGSAEIEEAEDGISSEVGDTEQLIGEEIKVQEEIIDLEEIEDEEVQEEEEDEDDPVEVKPKAPTKKEIKDSTEKEAVENDDEKEEVFASLQPAKSLDIKEKLLGLEEEKQERYNIVRNKLQSYKKIKQRFSKTVDSYRYAGELVAKISVLGRTVRLHLALDPDSYEVSKYHHEDLSSKNKYIFVPFTLKLRSKRSVKYAIELIEELMSGFDIPVNPNYKDIDYIEQVRLLQEEEDLKKL